MVSITAVRRSKNSHHGYRIKVRTCAQTCWSSRVSDDYQTCTTRLHAARGTSPHAPLSEGVMLRRYTFSIWKQVTSRILHQSNKETLTSGSIEPLSQKLQLLTMSVTEGTSGTTWLRTMPMNTQYVRCRTYKSGICLIISIHFVQHHRALEGVSIVDAEVCSRTAHTNCAIYQVREPSW